MNPINHLIHPNQQQLIRRPIQHCQIIPNAGGDQRRFALMAPNPIDQIELTRHDLNLLAEPVTNHRPCRRPLPIDRLIQRHMIRRHRLKIRHARQTRAAQIHRPIIIPQ